MKRDLRKAEEEEKWREKANNREQWKQNNESSQRMTSIALQKGNETKNIHCFSKMILAKV